MYYRKTQDRTDRSRHTYRLYIVVILAAVIIAAVFLLSGAKNTPVPAVIAPPEDPRELCYDDFRLVWSDEFDADALDASRWTGFRCSGGTAVVRQGGWWHTDLAEVKDGSLRIETVYFPEGFMGGGPGWYSCGLCTVGLLEQTCGYFEIRCILPKGTGMWAAFWLLPEDFSNTVGNGGTDGAEIDVFESPNYRYRLSDNVNVVTTNLHIDGYGSREKSLCVATPFINDSDPYEEFNTYGVEWNEDEYIFYINGIETGRSDFGGTSRVPEYIILSTEVGGSHGAAGESWAGPAMSADEHPSAFVIDYVRVYQYR